MMMVKCSRCGGPVERGVVVCEDCIIEISRDSDIDVVRAELVAEGAFG